MNKFSTDEMQTGIRLANDLVIDYFKDGKTTGIKAGAAIKYIASYRGLRQAENNEKSMVLGVISSISGDRKEFKKYIDLIQPEIIRKAIK